jgi:hypothetical protein
MHAHVPAVAAARGAFGRCGSVGRLLPGPHSERAYVRMCVQDVDICRLSVCPSGPLCSRGRCGARAANASPDSKGPSARVSDQAVAACKRGPARGYRGPAVRPLPWPSTRKVRYDTREGLHEVMPAVLNAPTRTLAEVSAHGTANVCCVWVCALLAPFTAKPGSCMPTKGWWCGQGSSEHPEQMYSRITARPDPSRCLRGVAGSRSTGRLGWTRDGSGHTRLLRALASIPAHSTTRGRCMPGPLAPCVCVCTLRMYPATAGGSRVLCCGGGTCGRTDRPT